MISHIRGVVEYISNGAVVVEAHGVGYCLNVTAQTLASVKPGDEALLFTHLNMREDGVSLFGFLTQDELDMFGLLITVSGVGPKVALGVLNTMKPKEISLAILTEDAGAFVKAPGIGKKTAQMIIFKLKDRVTAESASAAYDAQMKLGEQTDAKRDAIEALIHLGYSKNEALRSVLEIALPEMKTDQIIRQALRQLNR